MKSYLKIAIKLGISIILFVILYLLGPQSLNCGSTLAGSGAQAGCFTQAKTIPEIALYFLISVLIVWIADWIIGKLKK